MTFNPNIPQPGDLLSVSQGDLLNNATASNNLFGLEHVKWDDANPVERGKHLYVHLKDRTGTEPATTSVEGVVYAKQINANLQPVFRRESNGAELWMTPIRAFCAFNGTTNPNPTILDNYNVSNVVYSAGFGIGIYTISFNFSFTNTSYTTLVSGNSLSTSDNTTTYEIVSRSVNSVTVKVVRRGGSTTGQVPSPYVCVTILGGTFA